MGDSSGDYLRFVVAGRLNRDYVLPISGPPKVNQLGGNLTYAAVGLGLWGEAAGLAARVDGEFPLGWVDRFKSLGFDLSGIKVVNEPIDMRRFMAHADLTTTYLQNPVQYFADRGLPFPPELLGYRPNIAQSSRTEPMPCSLQISDIPEHYLEASGVHICAIDYVSHVILPSVFRQGLATTITLSSDPGYMVPAFWEEIPPLISGITAFITTEQEIRMLFRGRETDVWQMTEALAGFGPEFVLVRTASWGYYLYDRVSHRRWEIPRYQSRAVDPTGADDAFAGGFLAGYRENYDPLEAAIKGSITASFVFEGSNPFYALDALPELKERRMNVLRGLVREI